MRRYTTSDFNRTRSYNNLMSNRNMRRSLNEAIRIIDECDKKKDKELDEDDISEQELNELFGWGENIDKPAEALSLQNSDEENAELVIQWCAYFMAKAGNNVEKGLSNLFSEFGSIIVKAPKILVKGAIMLLSGTVKFTIANIQTMTASFLGCIFGTIRLINSGIEGAKNCLAYLYKALVNGFTQFYATMKNKGSQFIQNSEKKLKIWMAALTAGMMAVANEVKGAAEAMGAFFEQILKDAKEKVDAAVMIVKTWIQSKATAVLNWIKDTVGDIRDGLVKSYNALDKKMRSAYNNAVKKLEDWIASVKEFSALTAAKIKTAVEKGAEKSKEFVMDKKDKALIWGIQKGVKGLSDKYTEDQVVALVRKCYNESLKPMFNGNYRINESYFYDARTRRRMSKGLI